MDACTFAEINFIVTQFQIVVAIFSFNSEEVVESGVCADGIAIYFRAVLGIDPDCTIVLIGKCVVGYLGAFLYWRRIEIGADRTVIDCVAADDGIVIWR